MLGVANAWYQQPPLQQYAEDVNQEHFVYYYLTDRDRFFYRGFGNNTSNDQFCRCRRFR